MYAALPDPGQSNIAVAVGPVAKTPALVEWTYFHFPEGILVVHGMMMPKNTQNALFQQRQP